MQALGVSGGWMFFVHAGDAVAVELKSGDITDVFDATTLEGHGAFAPAGHTAEERRAMLLARSALATRTDPLRTFVVPAAVRASARQAHDWSARYERAIELPVVAAGTSLVPPLSVQVVAQSALDLELSEEARKRAETLSEGAPVPSRLIRQMTAYFDRHQRDRVAPGEWLSWGGDSGRTWAAKVTRASGSKDSEGNTISSILADEEVIDYDTLRLLPRAFSALNGPHTAECDGNGSCSCGGSKSSALYPSARALTYLALGGDAGRDWARRAVRRAEAEALLATGYDADAAVVAEEEVPDSESFDGDAPHQYAPVIENPDFCMYCGAGEMDDRHQGDAVDYTQADTTPEDAHYFSETLQDPEKCEICGKGVDDTLHKQAALAAYYLHKDDVDKKVAETQQYWQGQAESGGAQPEQPVTTAAGMQFVDWEEFNPDDPVEQTIGADQDLKTVFWERRGSEDDDPLTYYAAYTGDDSLTVDQLYMSDGAMFYRYEPHARTWEQAHLGSPEQVYELDDETAREVLRALSVFPDQPVDLREVDPGEVVVMAEAIPGLDHDMLDRVTVVTASGVTHDYTFQDEGYTPEERAANAKKQVRDAGGRFARSGSKIAVGPQAKTGTVTKIDPDTQQVQVQYDDGSGTEWVPAKSTRVAPETAAPAEPQGQPSNRGTPIPIGAEGGQPRATGRTPKAALAAMLPPMDAEALQAVVENYPNFIASERAGAAARAAAQQALDDQSKARYEQQQAKAQADYERRLEKIRAQGKKQQDAIDRIYRKILPGYGKKKPDQRYQAASVVGLDVFAKRKKQAAPANDVPAAPAAAGTGQPITDPAQSDVAPVYMAEVDEANQSAVLELLAMVPASTTGTDPQVLRYTAQGWVSDPKILRQLRSTAPPAIVALDEGQFNDTLNQVKHFYTTAEGKAEAEQEAKDAQTQAISAAAGSRIWGEYGEVIEVTAAGIPGIADSPGDVADVDRLKEYWTVGRGGAKVRWNTPGDWTRCNRHLKKYMPRPGMSEGYCANLHHLMTGVWPGDRNNVGRRGSAAERGQLFDVYLLTSQEVIDYSALVAAANALCAGVDAPEHVEDVPTELTGAPFVIPVLAPVGVKSGDGRHFAPLSLSVRDLPLPLMWQIKTAEGHDESVIVGRIDSIDRSEDGSLVNARGVFDVGPYGQEAERLVRHQFLRGVSVDLDNFEAEARSAEPILDDEKSAKTGEDVIRIRADDMTVTSGRVMGATLVAKPAFQEVRIQLEEPQEEETMVADGTYIGTPESEAETEEMIRSALTAAGIPVHPPAEWFEDPQLNTETPLTVLDDGRVYGHIATWNTEHVGLPFSTRPPRSRSNYAYFHTGLLRTASGNDVHVGQITLAGGHAPLEADAAMAVKHYDDTASAFCDVHAGEDAYGIWVAGALRPNVTAEQVRAIRAAAPSGDWRPINGRLEMVAVCQVNVPGFPVTRARVASGAVYALVAAGTSTLARIRAEADTAPLDKLIARVDALEVPQREALNQAREAALARMSPALTERNDRLNEARNAALSRFEKIRAPEAAAARERFASLMQDGDAYFRDIGTEARKRMAKEGKAMPDGQYPIANVGDLKNAIRAYGRAASGQKAAVRRHIKKRARALGKTDLIPESWNSLDTPVMEIAGEIMDLTQRMALVSGGATLPVVLQAPPELLDQIELISFGATEASQQDEAPEVEEDVTEDDAMASLRKLFTEFGRGPGWVTNPEATRRLHSYWVKGEGAQKIRWGVPGDFKRCETLVGEKIAENDPGKMRFIKNICAQWHRDATGATPGHAPGESKHALIDEEEARVAAGGRYPDGSPWNPQNHPRDEKGRFRLVIAELKKDLEGEAGTQQAVEGLDQVQQAANQGDVEAAQQAAKGVLDLVDQIAANTKDEGAVKTLREGYTNLADAVANLPLVFGDLNQKYRFSDLPPDLQGLITDLYKRAEQRLDPDHLDEAGGKIKEFMSGIDILSQPQISSELSRILRFLI